MVGIYREGRAGEGMEDRLDQTYYKTSEIINKIVNTS